MKVNERDSDDLHDMHCCRVTIGEPDREALRKLILAGHIVREKDKPRFLDILDVVCSAKRFACQRSYALRVTSGAGTKNWLSVDAGLDPSSFCVIFPDKKGKEGELLGDFEKLREQLKILWSAGWCFHRLFPTQGLSGTPGAAQFFNELFEETVSVSELSVLNASWNWVLERSLNAEKLLHREAFGYGMYSTNPCGSTFMEAVSYSHCNRMAALAPASVRRCWEEEGISVTDPFPQALSLQLHELCTTFPVWSVTEASSFYGGTIRDLIRTARERHWGPDSPEVRKITDDSRTILQTKSDEKIARWCSSLNFDSLAAQPEPISILERFGSSELSAESLYW